MKGKGKIGLFILIAALAWPAIGQSPATGFSKLAAVSSGTTYVDSTCPDGTTCYYQVFALDSNGVASSAGVPSALPPASFQGTQDYVTGVIPSAGTHSVTLSWTANTGDVSYVVYRYTPPLAPGGFTAVVN